MATSQRRLAAIMFTDMVGYSALAQKDETAAITVLRQHNDLLRPIFSRYHGREVKTVGDAFLVEFDSALEAAECAVEIQRFLHDYNLSVPEQSKIRIRIGIHLGDVIRAEGDVLGDAVNIASRVEHLADPEGVCVTQQVYDQIQNKFSAPLVRLAPTTLKNIQLPVTVYRVVRPWETGEIGTDRESRSSTRQLAVLPLANISPDANDAYFADGLTEELISTLSQVNGLSVTARTSVTPYKTAPKSIAEVGAELHVDTILEGSVRKSGNRIRITLQLVDVGTQRHVWAMSYNREIDDVFAVQTDIAERTAEALRLQLTVVGQAEAKRRPTENLAAYDAYLRGLVAANRMGEGALDEAVRCFEEATKLDPSFAEAYAAWANQYVVAAGDSLPMREVMPRARALAARALELNPNSSDAHAALGNIALQFDTDWKRAESEFREAIALNSSNLNAHRFLGLLLLCQERFPEAKEVLRRTIQLDPAGTGRTTLAFAELESGNVDAAIAFGEAERDADPSAVRVHVYLGFFYVAAGRRDDALREAMSSTTGASEDDRFDHALLNALVGRPEPARKILVQVARGELNTYVSDTHLAMVYSALGEKERALDLLEKDYREGDRILWLFHRSVVFDAIRDEPRFIALAKKYGLPGPTRRATHKRATAA